MAFSFSPGRPEVPCRPYTIDELKRMVQATIEGVLPTTQPQAVFVTGLPGSGKSSLLAKLLPLAEYAIVDADSLRGFHEQFCELATPPGRLRFKDAIPWFMEGSEFEDAVFRRPSGLMHVILDSRRSFVQLSVLNSDKTLEWVNYVISKGYCAHVLVIHVPAHLAADRAESRALATGRWCSRDHIMATEFGMLRWTRDVFLTCIENGGTARFFDNSLDHDVLVPPREGLTRALADAYGLHAQLLSPARVSEFARTQISLFPPGIFNGVSCSLAGGMYKCLLVDGSYPRDIDVWPCSATDEATLVARLTSAAVSSDSTGRWNNKFIVRCSGADREVVVEVARSKSRGLSATLAGFDIALSAIGVALESGEVTEVQVHPLAPVSVEVGAPLLVPGLPNTPFLLATAERVLRYARELGWPRPTQQMAELLTVFESCPLERATFIANYRETSLFGADRQQVLAAFGISDAEYCAE